jgi:hypothetical protein
VAGLSELTPDRIFALHPKIRWAGLATDHGDVIFAKMRPGVKSLSPTETDQSFVQLGPMLLSGVFERLVPWAGRLDWVIGRYEKVIMITTHLSERFLAVTLDGNGIASLQDVIASLQTLKPKTPERLGEKPK